MINLWRKYLLPSLAVAMLVAFMLVSDWSAKADAPATAVFTPVLTLGVGSATNQVGYQQTIEGGRGPAAFSVAPNGTLYLLDAVQQRVLAASGGTVVNTIALPSTIVSPVDLLATSDSMYLLDSNDRVLRVDYSGNIVHEYDFPPGLTSDRITRMVANPAFGPVGVVLWASNYRQFDLNNLPTTVDLDAGVADKTFSLSGITNPGGRQWIGQSAGIFDSILETVPSAGSSTVITLTTHGQMGTSRLIGFGSTGAPFMRVEDLYDQTDADGTHSLGVEETVRQFDPTTGALLGIARLPDQDVVTRSHHDIEVTPNGIVYVMASDATSTSIYQVTLGQTYASSAARPDFSPEDSGSQTNVAYPTQTPVGGRIAVRNRARQMDQNSIIWPWHPTYNKFANGNQRPGNVPIPVQLQNLADGVLVHGIP